MTADDTISMVLDIARLEREVAVTEGRPVPAVTVVELPADEPWWDSLPGTPA